MRAVTRMLDGSIRDTARSVPELTQTAPLQVATSGAQSIEVSTRTVPVTTPRRGSIRTRLSPSGVKAHRLPRPAVSIDREYRRAILPVEVSTHCVPEWERERAVVAQRHRREGAAVGGIDGQQ
jgi:hypothetical protein